LRRGFDGEQSTDPCRVQAGDEKQYARRAPRGTFDMNVTVDAHVSPGADLTFP
jgi:hypothetical protein